MSALTLQYKPKNKTLGEDHALSKSKRLATRPLAIQAKLTIGQPNDIYEQEADRLADKIMRMTDESLVQRRTGCMECQEEEGFIQSKPLFAQISPIVHRQSLDDEEEMFQAKSASSQKPQVTPAVESGINSLKGGGQPLSQSTRAFFEPRFGTDFSHVRVHTGENAAQTAQAINAKAYTTGNNIVFNQGYYAPESTPGKHLLAHELTHVVQQNMKENQFKREISLSNRESTHANNRVKQQVLENIIKYFRDYNYPYIEQNNVEEVIQLAEQFANAVADYRSQYFELDEESETEERDAVTGFVKERYSIYWWNKEFYSLLFPEALRTLYSKLKWHAYEIYE